ncbi:PASTA domain-containing protein [Nocardia halotolerans]|uniref:PASTA domain-containing protein n=1 Tax=Nocardia halotolerans TaxID=1755878 RepID=UPI003671F26D
MPTVVFAMAVLAGAAGCAAQDGATSELLPTTTPAAATTSASELIPGAPTTEAVAPTSTPEPAPAAIMPTVICMNLQEAQNAIQAAGVFFSRSEDASGKGRAQVMDRNWTVVAQEPVPGTPIGEGEAVLSVVKKDEPSQC